MSEWNKFHYYALALFFDFLMVWFPYTVSSVDMLYNVFNTDYHKNISNIIKNIFTALVGHIWYAINSKKWAPAILL